MISGTSERHSEIWSGPDSRVGFGSLEQGALDLAGGEADQGSLIEGVLYEQL